MTRPYIEAAAVRKIFHTNQRPVEVIGGASFVVGSGEFVSLLGPSGCGKSTLLMMIGGLDHASGGSLLVNGSPITTPRTSIGVIFQDATLLPWKTALENVLFPIDVLRLPVTKYRERAIALLRMVGLESSMDRRPHQLSGGMKQRVAICRALVYEPDLLLMDEPFSALDAISRDEMNVELLNLWEQDKKTVLFVTHSIREAVFLSDRVLVMGGNPSRVVSDIRCPFPRPRSFSVGETREFNEICTFLRAKIEEGYGRKPAGL